jgi:uncharacterized protein YdeI (YjbR/CyaY-like superfamily)
MPSRTPAPLPPDAVHPTTRAEWRAWLEQHHAREAGVWLVTWKVATGRPRMPYDIAVEEALVVPPDLARALAAYPHAAANFAAFPRSAKRGILEWIVQAKRAETRDRRVAETARLANENVRANQWPRT